MAERVKQDPIALRSGKLAAEWNAGQGSKSAPAPSAKGWTMGGGGGFDAAAMDNRLLEGWSSTLNPPNPIGGQRARDAIIARARDTERNDPVGRSALDRRVDNVIGSGWRFTAKPMWRALKIKFEQALEFGESLEALWEVYTKDPCNRFTPEQLLTWTEVQELAYRTYFREGEVFALVPFDDAGGTLPFGTRIQLFDADRVSNPYGKPDSKNLRQGVQLDESGRPIGVWIREAHPNDHLVRGRSEWRYEAYCDARHRPRIIHLANRDRIDQVRGVSQFAPVLRKLRALNVFDDAELQSKVVNALLAAVLESQYDPAEAARALDPLETKAIGESRLNHYQKHPVKNPLGGRVPVLAMGDQLKAVDTKRETGEDFVARALRSVAASLGMSYEQMTMDWSKVNYSSARAALLEVYKGIRAEQVRFAAGFMGPFLYAFIEEAFASGKLVAPDGAPSFHEMPAAYTNVNWIMPARGWVDPVKEAQAAGIRMRLNLTTLEDECAAQGVDWRETLEQTARERRERIKLKLPVFGFSDAVRSNPSTDKGEGGAEGDREFNEPMGGGPDAEPDGEGAQAFRHVPVTRRSRPPSESLLRWAADNPNYIQGMGGAVPGDAPLTAAENPFHAQQMIEDAEAE